MEAHYEGFSIREYTRNIRSVELRKCWPFSAEITGDDVIHSLLPPITVAKFRWWSHELASLLAKSPVTPDDSEPDFCRKGKTKYRTCKKRSIGAADPISRDDEGEDFDVVVGSKRKKTKDLVVQKNINSKKPKDSGDRKLAYKVNNSKEQARDELDDGKCSLGIKERSGVMSFSRKKAGVRCLSYTEEELFPDSPKSVSQDWDSEFQIHGIFKARRKVCSLRSPDKSDVGASQCERHVRLSDESGILSQLETKIISLELCCLQMNRLSLSSSGNQSFLNDKNMKIITNDQTSDNMQSESRQPYKSQPVVSERRLCHVPAKSGMSCFPTPHLSLERIKDALDFERKGHVAQPIQSFISSSSENQCRSCSSSSSQPASADMHCGTLLNQSPFDPLLMEWMQKSALHRQRHVEEAVSGFPLNLQGELVEANGEGRINFDRSGLGTGSSRSASAENVLLLSNLVDLSSGMKHSTEPALAKDVHSEKRHKYFPARLGLDETFTEKAFFNSDTNDGECAQTVHSSVSEVNLRSHTINLPKQDTLSQNLSSRNMFANCDGLCLHNTQSTMRLMGKDVSVGTSYSDFVRRGERIIAPDASVDCSFLGSHTHQSCWLWQRTTLGISENHSTTSLDKKWNRNLLCDTAMDLFPMLCETHVGLAPQARTAVVPDLEFPPTILYPCGSLVPLTDKDLNSHESGLVQQLTSVTFSQQQLSFQSTPEITGLPSDYSNVGIGLLPDARKPFFGLPFSFTDSTIQSQPHWPQSSFESSRSDMSFINPAEQLASLYGSKLINPAEQLASLYGSKPASYVNVGKAKKRLPSPSVDQYPMKNQKIPKFPMQGGLNHQKEFFCRP